MVAKNTAVKLNIISFSSQKSFLRPFKSRRAADGDFSITFRLAISSYVPLYEIGNVLHIMLVRYVLK